MFRIGEFSKLSCLSIAIIRYYGEIGILEPSYVNEENGYRYYEAEQLYLVSIIQSLKQVGFEISEIKELLGSIKEKEDLEKIVNKKYRKLECERENVERKLNGLKNMLDGLDKGVEKMDYIVNFKKMELMKIVYVRGVVDTYAHAGELWAILEKQCNEQNIKPEKPFYSMCIYHDKGYQKNDVDMSVALKVSEIKKVNEGLQFKEIAERNVASITFKGDYNQMHKVNREIGLWIQKIIMK